jgi:hypothetical protein
MRHGARFCKGEFVRAEHGCAAGQQRRPALPLSTSSYHTAKRGCTIKTDHDDTMMTVSVQARVAAVMRRP